jgi:hypothetical protein
MAQGQTLLRAGRRHVNIASILPCTTMSRSRIKALTNNTRSVAHTERDFKETCR